MMDSWRRGQRGWPVRLPVAQLPNAPLWVALGGRAIPVMTDGSVHAYLRAAFYAGLAAWGWEELVGASAAGSRAARMTSSASRAPAMSAESSAPVAVTVNTFCLSVPGG
jgi:hypothetical protein